MAYGTSMGKNLPVCAIEPHTDFTGERGHHFGSDDRDKFLSNVDGFPFGKNILLMNLTSDDAFEKWPKHAISLLFIDGCHKYEQVKRDFDNWSRYVIEDGYIMFHDSKSGGPKRVVDEIINGEYQGWVLEKQVKTITVLKNENSFIRHRLHEG